MTADVVLTNEELDAIEALDSTIEATPSLPQDKKSFGVMNGVSVEIELETQELETPPSPEEIVTTRVISQHPLLKAAVIGSGIFLVVAVAGGMINASMNALTNSTAVKPQPIKQAASADDKEESQSENPGKIKTALAITSQKPELESLRNLSKPTTTVKEANTAVKPSPVASSTSSSPTTQRQYASVTQSQPSSQPMKRSSFIRASSNSSTPTKAISYQSGSTPTPRPMPVSIVQGSSAANKSNVDPMQQWLTVSNIGSFSASSTETTTDEPINTEGLSGGTGTLKSVANTSTNMTEQTLNNQSKTVDYNARRVIVGTRTQGKLETPIAISAGNTIRVQKYLIKLTKPLKASDGTEVLPINSYLVVVPNNTNTSEYIQMSAIGALINVDGNTLEKTIPENSIIILNKNGETLRAQSRKGSNLGNDFMAAVIDGISKAAEIENNPSSQTTISSNGFSTSTVSNDKKNLVAGFAQGSFDQVMQRIQSSNQRQIQGIEFDAKVYVVPANTTVQIFVNQTISL